MSEEPEDIDEEWLEILEICAEESLKRLETLRAGLVDFPSPGAEDYPTRCEALRVQLHTVKGSVRMVGFAELGELVRDLEALTRAGRDGRTIDCALVGETVERLAELIPAAVSANRDGSDEDLHARIRAALEPPADASPEPKVGSPEAGSPEGAGEPAPAPAAETLPAAASAPASESAPASGVELLAGLSGGARLALLLRAVERLLPLYVLPPQRDLDRPGETLAAALQLLRDSARAGEIDALGLEAAREAADDARGAAAAAVAERSPSSADAVWFAASCAAGAADPLAWEAVRHSLQEAAGDAACLEASRAVLCLGEAASRLCAAGGESEGPAALRAAEAALEGAARAAWCAEALGERARVRRELREAFLAALAADHIALGGAEAAPAGFFARDAWPGGAPADWARLVAEQGAWGRGSGGGHPWRSAGET